MKFTCLCKGGGFHFPACHMLNVSGFRILLDCPLDLSSLAIFAPVPVAHEGHESSDTDSVIRKKQKMEKTFDANDLVHAEPWYKTVKSLHLWDASFIDVVLISSPMGMLGLPYLTRTKDFSAKIYVTEATARIGQLLMEDLVSMHMEFRQFYGPEDSCFPQWLRWEELEVLQSEMKKIALGKDCEELGAWMPLYSADDVKDCMRKVQTLKYAEEACYNGNLIIKAFSSGLEIGTCNWTINEKMENDNTYFDTVASLNFSDDVNNLEEMAASLLKDDESMEEMEKLAFICTCALDSVRGGGSVLIPIDRLGIILGLLEHMSVLLESSSVKVPIYVISSVAEELLAFTNIIPEWLCKQRQQKLFSGEPLFEHAKLIKERNIHVFPAVHSPELLTNWQEPCIIFSPHWSLRLGPVVHLLRHWCSDPNSLLVLESGVDADIALLPFKPMAMNVLQCSFLSGMRLQKVQPLLKTLQPKLVLFPKDLRCKIQISEANMLVLYSENETLRIPSSKNSTEIEIATDLASKFHWKTFKQETITRLEGELFMDYGKHRLLSGSHPADSKQQRPLVHWGSPDLNGLLTELSKMGINGAIKQVRDDAESESAAGIVEIHEPKKALIDVGGTGTVIISADENLASHIVTAIDIVLDGI
ncbi:integrator complex subunit 9 homolog isoform X2 [Herrania umbratica]|uniref:Integrator complex subunit 9 homolog isoform X2 n=1 Tax=Herrania umbratica TaxID=108875 RepID=A0A6J1BCU0_9ROSI|nr:integrator complex subunit 9 homolog isoform X2 [Herrania umbratica]